MPSRLNQRQIKRAEKLIASLPEPIDIAFPGMTWKDAVLCAKYLLCMAPDEAEQMVAACRGEDVRDLRFIDADDESANAEEGGRAEFWSDIEGQEDDAWASSIRRMKSDSGESDKG